MFSIGFVLRIAFQLDYTVEGRFCCCGGYVQAVSPFSCSNCIGIYWPCQAGLYVQPLRTQSWDVSSHCKYAYAVGSDTKWVFLRHRVHMRGEERMCWYAQKMGCKTDIKIISKVATSAKVFVQAPVDPTGKEEYNWRTRKKLINAHQRRIHKAPNRFPGKDVVVQNSIGLFLIPKIYNMLQVRLMIVGHTGLFSHWSAKTTQAIVSVQFWWSTIQKDFMSFVTSWLHCLF